MRSPTRFAIVAALGLGDVAAGALAALGERWPHGRAIGSRRVLLLVVELLPAPRTLYSAKISPLSRSSRTTRGRCACSNLPFGVRDGTSSAGNFSARYQFNQTLHGKPLIGGYLSRVSSRRVIRSLSSAPLLRRPDRISAGRHLAAGERATSSPRRRPSSPAPTSVWAT